MAITNYAELKTAILNFMERQELSGDVEQFIALAEARLNRIVDASEADAILAGTIGSRRLPLAAIDFNEIKAVILIDAGEERILLPKVDGTFPYADTFGEPDQWAIDGSGIDFNCLLSKAYQFRVRYSGRLKLSDAAPTNDFLTKNPDIYLSAAIVWGGAFIRDDAMIAQYKSAWDEFVFEANHETAQNKRSVLQVDPALGSLTAYASYRT
jgi:hypothetical protein